jgi:predicted nucleotidyltransferase component of viral defense system
MKYSKEQIMNLAENSGFRLEILEKVLLLMDLLEAFFNDPVLKNKIALKGGTALNLFYLNLPRLSVDIDLNYIGEVDRIKMLVDKKIFEKRIMAICERQGLVLYRKPMVHAGGKIIWRYPSILGHIGSLEVDINYMYRVPLLPIKSMTSFKVGDKSIDNISVLDINELAAGKLSALIDRTLGRDLFDTYHLISSNLLNIEILRLILVVYGGMSRKKDLRNIEINKIVNKFEELNNRLFPMLSNHYLKKVENRKIWVENMQKVVQNFLESLFPLRIKESAFLDELLRSGEIKPEILTEDIHLQNNIKIHPAIIWNSYKTKEASKKRK